MADAFGLDSDVYFGDAEKPLPDWRKDAAHETDDDNEDEPQPGVAEMLGFDPAELDESDAQESFDEARAGSLVERAVQIIFDPETGIYP